MPRRYRHATQESPHDLRQQGASWRPADEAELRRLASTNTPTRMIGLKLGRSVKAVRLKSARLGLSLGATRRLPAMRVT